MTAQPAELAYQTGRNVYFVRVSITGLWYNTDTGLYEAYNASNWADYANTASEVGATGFYRGTVPEDSLGLAATEVWYQRIGASPSLTDDVPPIGTGNSQGVNVATSGGSSASLGSNPSAVVDVCNLALMHLGKKRITSLSDEVEAARVCNLIFNNLRDTVLRAADWNFASVIGALTLLDDEEVTGWSYVYEYPDDLLKIRKVYAEGTVFDGFPIFPFEMVDQLPFTDPSSLPYRVIYNTDLAALVIVANLDEAVIEYTARVADPDAWDPMFIKALSYRLAADLAKPLGGSREDRDEMLKLYFNEISDAKRVNGNETGVPRRQSSPFLDAR